VYFKYPGSDNFIFNDFSMKILPGEHISLVGINGSGKTTFVRLLLRYYDVSKGEILINGINIKKLSLEEWWSSVRVLFQDFVKYNFTVKDSISLGDISKDNNLDDIIDAGKKSEADSFIDKLPDKYDQQIGKQFSGGTEISGGQHQRLALARVLYRKSFVTILDEPTAAVDASAEEKIFKTLNKQKGKSTIITISHRFSTVRRSDKIFVVDKGTISEEGTHEELMKNSGIYNDLYTKQKKAFDD
jgi:ATP-binding cassette subfamily B protein